MKVKLDENIPVSLVEALAALGHDVQTVIGQGLTGRADAEIWRQCLPRPSTSTIVHSEALTRYRTCQNADGK